MNKKEMTYKTVKQLSVAEKRLFRMEISKFKNSTYILLYEFLDRQEEYDEKKLNAYCSKRKIQSPNTHIAQLFKKLIDFCLQHRESIYEDEVDRKIKLTSEKAELYLELGFIDYTAKELKKALQLADQHKRYWLMPNNMHALCFMLGQLKQNMTFMDDIFSDNMPLSRHRRMEWIMKKMTPIYINQVAGDELFNANRVLLATPERDKVINKLLDFNPLPFEKGDFFAFSGYYFVKQEQAYAKNDLRLFKQIMEEALEALPQYYHIASLKVLEFYSSTKFELCKTLFWLEPKEFLTQSSHFLNTIKNIADEYKTPRTQQDIAADKLKEELLSLKALFLKPQVQTDDIKRFIPPKEKINPLGERSNYKHRLIIAALLFVIIREYKESDNCYKRLQPLLSKINTDVQIAAELQILEAIKAFEGNEEYYAKQLIKKLKHKSYKGNAIPEINQFLTDLLHKIQKLKIKKQQIDLMKASLPKLLQLEQSTIHKYLPFSYWMKKRIEEGRILS